MGKNSSKGSYATQSNNGDAWVGVKNGTDRKSGRTTTDIIVADKAGKEHHHIVIDRQGNSIYEGTRADQRRS